MDSDILAMFILVSLSELTNKTACANEVETQCLISCYGIDPKTFSPPHNVDISVAIKLKQNIDNSRGTTTNNSPS